MEQFIPLIILALASFLFRGKKEEPDKKRPSTDKSKPFTASSGQPDPFKKLKEMSQEMYKEIQREFQETPAEPPSRQTPIETSRPAVTERPTKMPSHTQSVSPVAAQAKRERSQRDMSQRETHRGRLSAHGAKHVWKPTAANHHEMIPKDQEDLVKGIIFSEILGPPKAKR